MRGYCAMEMRSGLRRRRPVQILTAYIAKNMGGYVEPSSGCTTLQKSDILGPSTGGRRIIDTGGDHVVAALRSRFHHHARRRHATCSRRPPCSPAFSATCMIGAHSPSKYVHAEIASSSRPSVVRAPRGVLIENISSPRRAHRVDRVLERRLSRSSVSGGAERLHEDGV